MKMEKEKSRQHFKSLSQSVPYELVNTMICELVRECDFWPSSKSILFYWPFKGEVSLIDLLDEALKAGKNCYLPKVLDAPFPCAFSPINSMDEALMCGLAGNKETSGKTEIDFTKLDLVFVPALAFDKSGYRLGRGRGFYDRLLKTLPPQTLTVGLIPSLLLVDQLNCLDEWDYPAKQVITERKIIKLS